MTLLRLNKAGIELFTRYIDSIKAGMDTPFPSQLLIAGAFAEPVGGETEWLDNLNLDDRLVAARQLKEVVDQIGLKSAEYDGGFWSWCSAYLFERLCKRSNNKLAPGEIALWIAEPTSWKRYYRHYLASIWRVYQAHFSREAELRVLLNGPVNTPGELWAQIAATQTLITNPSLIEALYLLYWDKNTNSRKKGAGGSSPRRLTKVLRQFEKTYDFFAMSGNDLIEMLPAEFDRFK